MGEGHQWNADVYSSQMGFVTKGGESLIELLGLREGDHVIDWGCGNGELTACLASFGVHVTGIDFSREMIARARSKYPELAFIQADGQRYVHEREADAIFSNAALHWMTDADGTASSMAASLRSGGRLAVEFGGEGNIAAVRKALTASFAETGAERLLQFPWYFPSVGAYTSLLERHGFRVDFAVCYDRPSPLEPGEDGLQLWLDTFANGLLEPLGEALERAVRNRTQERLRAEGLWDGQRWTLDYRRIRVKAVRR